jgi:hypothetical protein
VEFFGREAIVEQPGRNKDDPTEQERVVFELEVVGWG